MDITYLGHSSFKIRGKNVTVVTDPFDNYIGIKFPRHTAADIVTISHEHQDHNAGSQVEGNPFVVRGPGEYEVKGVGIVGIGVYHDKQRGRERGPNTMYRIDIDGISLGHLGDLGHTLATNEVEQLDGIHILFVPVGGVYTIDAKEACEVVKDIDPLMVIPMHYGRAELDQKIFKDLSSLSVFLKEIGVQDVAAQPKLSLTRDKPPETMQVVVLE